MGRWIKCGCSSLDDDPWPGRPAGVIIRKMIASTETLVMNYRRITIGDIAWECNISYASVFSIIHEHLRVSKVSARWTKLYCSFTTMSLYTSRGLYKLESIKVSLTSKIIHATGQIWPPAITTYLNILNFIKRNKISFVWWAWGCHKCINWGTNWRLLFQGFAQSQRRIV